MKIIKKLVGAAVTTFEYLCDYATVNNSHFLLLGIYRPGSQAISFLFLDELPTVFEQLATYSCPIVVCADYNIHVDECDDANAIRLAQLIESVDCTQHIDQQTHIAGHTLDQVITRSETTLSEVQVG